MKPSKKINEQIKLVIQKIFEFTYENETLTCDKLNINNCMVITDSFLIDLNSINSKTNSMNV